MAAEAALPPIKIVREGDHYRLTGGQFRVSQGAGVNEAINREIEKIREGKQAQTLESDFDTVDPANHLSKDAPIERAIWDYWQTFRCVEGSSPGRGDLPRG